VTVVYIATLHPFHYAETRRALMADKHCLVEKPATLNGAEWADLSALAKARNLFLMEGTAVINLGTSSGSPTRDVDIVFAYHVTASKSPVRRQGYRRDQRRSGYFRHESRRR
jgi:hypothetical protein